MSCCRAGDDVCPVAMLVTMCVLLLCQMLSWRVLMKWRNTIIIDAISACPDSVDVLQVGQGEAAGEVSWSYLVLLWFCLVSDAV